VAISFTDLDQLAGEVLPERTVLATVSTPFNNAAGGDGGAGSASSSAAAAAGGDGGSDGATAINGQQNTVSQGTPGLLGSLGLGSNNPGSTSTATPGAIASY
jgi:hypothetical protein